MEYAYDIFISYKREQETLRWITNHFLPLLKLRVGLELGREPKIFLDTQIEAGSSWPLELSRALSSSKILIPLWTRTYFNSEWCTVEMSHMLEREEKEGCRTLEKPHGLIVPAVIHDGDTFPKQLSMIQRLEIQSCFNVRMHPDSPKAEQLEDMLSRHSASIAHAINNSPNWQQDWGIQAVNKFFNLYHQTSDPVQNQLPKFANL